MSDRERADAVLEHVAVLAFLYYPGIEVADPSYRLADDIEWCLARLGDVDMRAHAAIEIRAEIAVAARVVDHAHGRGLPRIAHTPAPPTPSGRGVDPRDLGKFIDRRRHACPIPVGKLTFHRNPYSEL